MKSQRIEYHRIYYYFYKKVYSTDYDVVLASVINNGDSLKYASDRLRQNEEIVAGWVEAQQQCHESKNKQHTGKRWSSTLIRKLWQVSGNFINKVLDKTKVELLSQILS